MPRDDVGTAVVLFCVFALVVAVSMRLALMPAIEALTGLREQFHAPERMPGAGQPPRRCPAGGAPRRTRDPPGPRAVLTDPSRAFASDTRPADIPREP